MKRNKKNISLIALVMLGFTGLFQSKSYAQTPTADKNYIVHKTPLISGMKNEAELIGVPIDELSTSITYSDGFGRTIQSIGFMASPNEKDMIQFSEFDDIGRQSTAYLPYTASNATGAFRTSAKTDQASFYNTASKIGNDTAPWVKTIFDESPLGRVKEQGAPGAAWQPGTSATTRVDYTTNTAGEVYQWEITELGDCKLTSNYYYAANTLYVTTTKGPNWVTADGNNGTTKEYKDEFGRVVLSRSYNEGNTYDTYSVYDVQGRLRFIIPPEAMNKMSDPTTINDDHVFTTNTTLTGSYNGKYYYMLSTSITLDPGFEALIDFELSAYPLDASLVEEYLFQNEYDDRNRLVGSKTPGSDWVYTVYDDLGGKIMTQDGNQRSYDQWSFVKYDKDGRAILAGNYTDTRSRGELQAYVDTNIGISLTRYEESGSVVHGYTNNSFPPVFNENECLLVTYYDNYNFRNEWGNTQFRFDDGHHTYYTGQNIERTKGLTTGVKVKVLGENLWMKTINYYDENYNVLKVISDDHMGSHSSVLTLHSFTNQLTKVDAKHGIDSFEEINIVDRMEYDHNGRLKKQWQSIENEPEILVAQFSYNELGEVIDKELHSTNGVNFIQSIDYRQNIRGWLTSINNADRNNDGGLTNDETGDLFGMELYYNNTPSGLTFISKNDGNITGTTWANAAMSGIDQRSYAYGFDHVGQLKSAAYKEKNNGNWNTKVGHYNVSNINYDLNGNIKGLQRNHSIGGSALLIDDLAYEYDGNKLRSIDDNTNHDLGFKDGAESSVEFTYDANGNMTSDTNKLIQSITYNERDMPDVITFTNGDRIEYTYASTGSKLAQKVYVNGQLLNTTDYSNGIIFDDGRMSIISTSEGRIVVEEVADDKNYDYQYYLDDHLGNNRVMFAPQTRTYYASMESENSSEEEAQFLHVNDTRVIDPLYNHTSGGNESAMLNAALTLSDGTRRMIGPSKAMKLYAGDVIDMEVYAKYGGSCGVSETAISTFLFDALSAAYGLSSTGGTESIFNAFDGQFAGASLLNQTPCDVPAAYLNYIFFDKNYQNPISGFKQITSSSENAFEKLDLSFTAADEGYLFTYVSNESSLNVNVYFDDFLVTHTSDASVLQADDYYPFGLPMDNNSFTEARAKANRFLYQGKEWQTDLALNLYDFHARQYDPAIGRFLSTDPQNQFNSPYLGMGNTPIIGVDPDGEFVFTTAMLIGIALNVTTQTLSGNINSLGDWGLAIGVGAASGAIGAGAGQAALKSAAAAGTGIGATTGAISGAAGGAAGGFAGGLGNSLTNGSSIDQALVSGLKEGIVGGIAGGIIGGVSSGIRASKHGGNFFTGDGAAFESTVAADALEGAKVGERLDYNNRVGGEFSDKHFGKIEGRRGLYTDGSAPTSRGYSNKGDQFINKKKQTVDAITVYHKTLNKSDVFISKAAFSSPEKLYLTMGHEYMHVKYNFTGVSAVTSKATRHASIYEWEYEQAVKFSMPNAETYNLEKVYESVYNKKYHYSKYGFKLIDSL